MVRGGFGRKGMSPLIATVLLMAFAVALGGMIMNWKFDLSVNTECDQLQEHIAVSVLCTQGTNITLLATADAESPDVQGIKLAVRSGNVENIVNVLNGKLTANGRLSLSIPVYVPEGSSVEVLGIVGPTSDPFVCTDTPMQRVDPILPCQPA